MIRLFSVCLVFSLISPVWAQNGPLAGGDPNHVILSLLTSMPIGGGYSATADATRDLQSAVQARGGMLRVNPSVARKTYCSGATYLVFVRAIQSLLPPSAFAGGLAEATCYQGATGRSRSMGSLEREWPRHSLSISRVGTWSQFRLVRGRQTR